MASPSVSVVIPCFNGAERIPGALAALGRQQVEGSAFEVLVIDNGSTDRTGRVAEEYFSGAELRGRGARCCLIQEPRKGLTHARIRGVLEAAGPFVCFLDDDTLPGPQYVTTGMKAFQDETVGLLVSRLYPQFSGATPPASLTRRLHLFAINFRLGDEEIRFGPRPTIAPTAGAGLWVRREAFLRAVPWQQPERLLSDRTGKILVSGGDIEIGYLIGKAGYDRLYCPQLRLEHVIPPSRFRTGYVCKLITGIVRSQLTLDAKYLAPRNRRDALRALGNLLGAVAATPLLLARPDGRREWLFVLVHRWADLRGPYT
jgi:glycosyltransferase involved in cell wall biosynthesis